MSATPTSCGPWFRVRCATHYARSQERRQRRLVYRIFNRETKTNKILRAIWQTRSWLWVIDTKHDIYVPQFEYSTVLSLCSYTLIVLAYYIIGIDTAQPMDARDFGLPKINNYRQ